MSEPHVRALPHATCPWCDRKHTLPEYDARIGRLEATAQRMAREIDEDTGRIATLQARVEELEEKERENFNSEVDAKKRHDILAGQGRRLYELNKKNMELEEHNQNAQSLNGLLELRVEEMENRKLVNLVVDWYMDTEDSENALACWAAEKLEEPTND